MLKNFIRNGLMKWTLIISIVAVSIYVFLPFFIALILGGVFAAVLSPYYEKMIIRFKMRRWTAALSFLSVVFVFAVVPFWAFIFRGVKLTIRFVNETFPQLNLANGNSIESQFQLESLQESLMSFASIFGIDQQSLHDVLNTIFLKVGQFLLGLLQGFILQLPEISIAGIIILLAMYFALVDTPKIKKFFYKYSGLNDSQNDRFVRTLQDSGKSIVLANIMTGFVQAIFVTAGSAISGIGDPWIVFFITFIASFIPIGAGPVAVVLAIMAFTTSQVAAGISLLVLAGVTGSIDNILRSFLMKGEGELHPFVAFMAVIGGVIMFGLPGLIIGPLVAALLIHCLPILIESDI